MNDSKKITFITTNKFPNKDAGSIRYVFLGKLFSKLGYSCFFIGQGPTKYKTIINDGELSYTSLRFGLANNIFSKIINHFFMERRLINYAIKNHVNSAYFVICFPVNKRLKKRLVRVLKAKKIGLIFSIMEWYSEKTFPDKGLFLRNEHRKNNEFYSKIQVGESFSFISISTYLHKYMVSNKINSVRIPFVMDVCQFPFEPIKNIHVHSFFYAGRPGNKDNIEIMIQGFLLLREEKLRNILVNFIGFSIFDISKEIAEKISKYIGINFHFWGVVSNDVVKQKIRESDFTILMRPPHERYAQAGFPTKITESLFSGIPIISNLTSDLNLYLIDRYNSFIVKDYTAEAFCNEVENGISLSSNEILKMKFNAYQTATEMLDISCYIDSAKEFLEKA